jgi:hypothetical protein
VDDELFQKNIRKIKWCLKDALFEYLPVDRFKEIFNGYPRKVEIILFNLPIFLEDVAIINYLIKDYHISPTGGHEGVTRTVKRISQK